MAAKRRGRKGHRSAAQRAATQRMLAAAAERRGGGGAAPKRRRKGGSKALAARGGMAHAPARGHVAFLPFTKANLVENQRRFAHGMALMAAHLGHTKAQVARIEDACVRKGILESRYSGGGYGGAAPGRRRRR